MTTGPATTSALSGDGPSLDRAASFTRSAPPTDASEPVDSLIATLRHRVDGDVFVPGDPGFDATCRPWNTTLRHAPAVVVVADDVGDVVAAVTCAAGLGRGLGVQCSGHGVAACVDGVLLVTDRLDDVEIDVEARTAWVGAGASAAAVLAAAQAHGLAPLVGSSPSVGMVGYTLGGGLGWLARRFGPACDAVRSFEVVTPDGELVFASRDEHPELFHALRGSGGCACVVTEMEIELHPVADVYAGNLYYPAAMAPEIVARWAAWVTTAPDELTSAVVLANLPDVPGLPAAVRGRSVTAVRGCWCGSPTDGRALLDEWRAIMPPELDDWSTMPFADSATISRDPTDPLPVVGTGGWLEDLDHDAGRAVGEVLAAATFGDGSGAPRLMSSQVRHVGGAVAGGDRGRSAMGNRDRMFLLQLVGVAPTAADVAPLAAHEATTKSRLGAHLSDRTFVNVLDGEERRRCASTALDADGRRAVAAARAAHDPADLLRFGLDHDA